MKYVDSEKQMNKYAFYFEGQSYAIRRPEAVAVGRLYSDGKTPKASHSRYGRLSISDNKFGPDHKGCNLLKSHHKRKTTDQAQNQSKIDLLLTE